MGKRFFLIRFPETLRNYCQKLRVFHLAICAILEDSMNCFLTEFAPKLGAKVPVQKLFPKLGKNYCPKSGQKYLWSLGMSGP